MIINHIKILKIEYNVLYNMTTIFYEGYNRKNELIKKDLKTFNGKIKFKGSAPTEYETWEFIKINGGLN